MMRGEGRNVPETGSLGLLDIESLARVLVGQANIPTVGAAVKTVPQQLPLEFRCFNEAGMVSQWSNYYPSQSAKTLLKEFFELNPPTHLDPAHKTTRISSSQMIQFAQCVGLEVALASYGMLIVKSGV